MNRTITFTEKEIEILRHQIYQIQNFFKYDKTFLPSFKATVNRIAKKLEGKE